MKTNDGCPGRETKTADVKASNQSAPCGNDSHFTHAGEDGASSQDDAGEHDFGPDEETPERSRDDEMCEDYQTLKALERWISDVESFEPAAYQHLRASDVTDKWIADRFVEHSRSSRVRITGLTDKVYVFNG